MALVLQVVNLISSSSTQHLAEFAVWYLPAVTENYYCLLNILKHFNHLLLGYGK